MPPLWQPQAAYLLVRRHGLRPLVGWAWGSGLPSIGTLTDDFTTADTTKWTFGGTATVTGGRLVLTCAATYADQLSSVGVFSLTGSQVIVELVSPANVGTGTTETVFGVYGTALNNNSIVFDVSGGALQMKYAVGATQNFPFSPTYDPVAHRWLRIREAAGGVFWDTSADGSTWTNQTSVATPIAIDALHVGFQSGYYGTESAPGQATFDNVNVAAAPTSSAAGAITLDGTAAAAVTASASGSVTLGGAATGGAVATASGGITLAGTATARAAAAASGSLILGGTAVATGPAVSSGTITLGGTSSATAPAAASGGVTLSGTTAATAPTSASGTITLGGSAQASGRATAAGTITLGGSATATAPATISGTVTLGGSSAATAPAASSGTVTLSATATARAPAQASGAITLGGTATAGTPGASPASASGGITLSGTATATARATASGAITLGGTAGATASAAASGGIALGGAVTVAVPATAAGLITLSGLATAQAGGALRDVTLTVGDTRTRSLNFTEAATRSLTAVTRARTLVTGLEG